MVVDGLAYLAYWNDGLVILDVGNGMKGGSPESPQFVSQFKYDLDAVYARVEQLWGPGFVRGTHTAWRAGRYVFVGDEVYPAAGGYPGPLGGDNPPPRPAPRVHVFHNPPPPGSPPGQATRRRVAQPLGGGGS